MTEHKYHQALRWLADGHEVLARFQGGKEDKFPGDFGDRPVAYFVDGHEVLATFQGCKEDKFPGDFGDRPVAYFVDGADGWTFRLKPRTVKIGNREVEAPVLEPEEGQQVYFHGAWNSRNEVSVYSIRFSPKSNPRGVGQMRAKGLLFATEEACQAAHDAIHALLRGEA